MKLIRFASLGLAISVMGSVVGMFGCQKLGSHHGSRNSSGIINGQPVLGTEAFATAVIGLGNKTVNGYEIFCSGSLISPNTVVTAAHCLNDLTARRATYVVFGLSESAANLQARKIIHFAFNDAYQADAPDDARDRSDIGLARFEGALPAGYAPAEILEDPTVLKNGTQVLVAGFGVDDGTTQVHAGTLRYTQVNILDATYGANEIETDETHNGTCNGDSGGPALVSVNNKFYLWGATSRGDDNCVQDGIYTKITAYRDWINEKAKEFDAEPIEPTRR